MWLEGFAFLTLPLRREGRQKGRGRKRRKADHAGVCVCRGGGWGRECCDCFLAKVHWTRVSLDRSKKSAEGVCGSITCRDAKCWNSRCGKTWVWMFKQTPPSSEVFHYHFIPASVATHLISINCKHNCAVVWGKRLGEWGSGLQQLQPFWQFASHQAPLFYTTRWIELLPCAWPISC